MRWLWFFLPGLCLLLLACSPSSPAHWWKKPHKEWPQILLTNQIEFEGRPKVTGASAFLLYYKNDTVVCTARHVVEKPIGIIPSVPQDSVNVLLKKWQVFPRATADFDTIEITKLRNTSLSTRDFLMLNAQTENTKITALEPSLDSVYEDDILYLIGCERTDKSCSQNVFSAQVRWVLEHQIIVEPEISFNPAGFSGGPAITKFGKAAGVITGVNHENDKTYIYIEPIAGVLPYLNQ